MDGTRLEAWASLKSFRPRQGSAGPPPDDPGNPTVNFHGERRRNDTHESTMDPQARLYRKGPGREATLAYLGHVLLDTRHGLVANVCVTTATGTDGRVRRDQETLRTPPEDRGARRHRRRHPARGGDGLRAAGGQPLRRDAAARRRDVGDGARLPLGLRARRTGPGRSGRRAGRRCAAPGASDGRRRGQRGARPGLGGLVGAAATADALQEGRIAGGFKTAGDSRWSEPTASPRPDDSGCEWPAEGASRSTCAAFSCWRTGTTSTRQAT